MMRFFIALSLLLLGASALHEEVIKAQWTAYKAKHGKEYHPSEEASRLNNFLETTIHIENHNARFHRGEVSYELGHNHLSDLSEEEFIATSLGFESMDVEEPDVSETPFIVPDSLPESVDWRSKCTPIKSQGLCGSCYAFSVVGVIEALYYNKTGRQADLSEQQIVDCSYQMLYGFNKGCLSGHAVIAMKYIEKGGLLDESSYPYTSGWTRYKSTGCMSEGQSVSGLGQNLKFVEIPKNETALAQAVAHYGPVTFAMYANNRDFKQYKSGIYSDSNCEARPNHLMSLVGYGTEDGVKYWIIRNSWGTQWGENGYARILRGVNQCGIVTSQPRAIILP